MKIGQMTVLCDYSDTQHTGGDGGEGERGGRGHKPWLFCPLQSSLMLKINEAHVMTVRSLIDRCTSLNELMKHFLMVPFAQLCVHIYLCVTVCLCVYVLVLVCILMYVCVSVFACMHDRWSEWLKKWDLMCICVYLLMHNHGFVVKIKYLHIRMWAPLGFILWAFEFLFEFISTCACWP